QEHRLVQRARIRAPVRLRVLETEEAELAETEEEVAGELALRLPLARERPQLLLHHRADRPAEGLVLLLVEPVAAQHVASCGRSRAGAGFGCAGSVTPLAAGRAGGI